MYIYFIIYPKIIQAINSTWSYLEIVHAYRYMKFIWEKPNYPWSVIFCELDTLFNPVPKINDINRFSIVDFRLIADKYLFDTNYLLFHFN